MGRRLALGALVHAALIAVVAAAYFGLGHGLLAALVAGALFHPVRRGLQLLVGLDRDPYRLVDAVSRSVETAGGSAEALSSGATAIGEALKARGVLIEIDGRPTVTHGTLDGEVAETPLVWQGRTVGRLVVAGGDRSRGLHEMLARHLAEVVHAVQLTEALERAKERLVEAREEERGRLLRVLDGELGSALAELSDEVRQARTWVRERQEAADAVLKRVRERLAEAIADVRDFVYGLRPPEPAPEQPPVVTAARTPAPEPVVEPLSWRARAVVWVAWTGGVVSPLLVLAATWLAWQAKWAAGWQPIDPIGTMFPAAAAFLIRYRRRLFIQWLMWSIGLTWAMYEVAYGLSYWLHQEIPGHPLLPYVTWVSAWAWVWPVMGFGAVMPLLFPDGHLPARRWRWVMYGVVAMTVIHTLDMALMPDMWRETRLPVENPFGVAALGGWPWFAESHIGWVMLPLSALAVTALGVRYWRAGPDTRRQIVWYVATMISYTVLWIARQAIADGDGSSTGSVMIAINLVVSAGVPISIVASVLRHRIYGISVILYRTLVYGTLATLLTLVYVGMLWSGNLLAGGLGPTAGLAAALAVGAVFHPVRLRLQRSVDQLLGVERDPYRAADELSRSVQRA
ncbi:MAG: hypothetical protein HOY71_23470, partial [Nonomuraea sp.]|nr:hypothetical protein [Nonomuraea sp.]